MTFFYDLNKRLADLDRPQTQTLTESTVAEKIEPPIKTDPSERGKYKGQNIDDLKRQMATVKDKMAAHKERGEKVPDALRGKFSELTFAIRAKQAHGGKWGKIKEGEVDEGPEVFKLKADAARKAGAKEFEGPDGKTYPVKEGNDGNLANNAKPYDKVTRGDVIAGRLGKDEMGGKAKKIKEQGVAEGSEQNLSVQQLATISDEALDKAYGYGRSNPGNTFGWQANLMSAAYAKKMIDAGVTDIEKISDAIHKGWNVTAQKFVQNPDQFDDTEKLRQAGKLEAKLAQRAKLMKINYGQLDNEEQEKDRVVARALLQAIKGQQGVAEDQVKEAQTYGPDNPYQVKPGENFGKVFEPGRRSGVHYHLNTGMVTDPFYFKLNNKLYSVSNKGDGIPREVGTNDRDLGQDVSMPSLIDYPGTDDPNLKLAKDYAKLMGYNPEDMDEIKPLLAVMKSNPAFKRQVQDKVKNQDNSKKPFGNQGVAEGWDDMLAAVEKRREKKTGEIERGHKHDIKHTATGRMVTRRTDDQGISVGTDDESKPEVEKRGVGRPKKDKAPERVTAKAYKHKHGRVEEGMEDEMPAGNYETGERGEYDREGDMAKEQLHTIEQAAQELKSILSDEENLPEWVQSKITKAMDYVDTARDYMLAQHDDRVNERELSKAERKEKERVFKKDMKPQMADFKKRYGKEQGENVAHAVATNIAKGVKMGKKKKEESVDETTTSGSVAVSDAAPKGKKGMSFGKGIYDSVNREVEKLIAESMSINASINTDQHGGPSRTLTVNATDDDAEKLAALLMMAGIVSQDSGCPSCGAASCGCDQQMDEAYGDTDATENQPDWPTAQEGSDDALQYSGGLNKPKATGQTTVPVTGVQPAQSPLMYENSDLIRMLEMAGMDAAQLEPYRHTMKETDAEKSSVVKQEPGGFSATAPAGKRLSVTLGKQPLKPSDVKVKDKDMDENLVVTPAPSAGSTAKPATPSAGSTTKPAPAPAKPGPTMGTIKGGVWTADPPKKGERGVPMPTPISEPVNETEPPEFSMGAGRPMPQVRDIKPEPEMSMGATGKVDRSAVPMTVPPGVAGAALDAGQMASLRRTWRGAHFTPNLVGTQPEGQMGATGNPQRPMKPLTKPLDLHTDPKVTMLPNPGPQLGAPKRPAGSLVRTTSMENNLMRELANFKGKK